MKKHVRSWQMLCLFFVLLLWPSMLVYSQDINIAYNPLPFNLPSLIEQNQEFLEDLGYTVYRHTFPAGYAMTEAMASGSLDIAPVMGATSTIVSRAGGRQIKVVGVYSQAPKAFALATKPGLLHLQELKGKSIAVPVGTEAHLLLAKILAEQGLKLKDIRLVNLLIPDGITALQSGQVDATMVVEPMLSRLERNGAIEVLRTGEGLIQGLTLSVVPSDLAQSEIVQAFQIAHGKSLAYLANNFADVLTLAIETMNLPEDIVKNIAKKYTFNAEVTDEVKAELAETIQFLVDEKIIRNSISVNDLLD